MPGISLCFLGMNVLLFGVRFLVEPEQDPHGYKSQKERHEATYGTNSPSGHGFTPPMSGETIPHIPFLTNAPLTLQSERGRARRIDSDTRAFMPPGSVAQRRVNHIGSILPSYSSQGVYIPPPTAPVPPRSRSTQKRVRRAHDTTSSASRSGQLNRVSSHGSLFRASSRAATTVGLQSQNSSNSDGVFDMDEDGESVRLERTNSGLGNTASKALLEKC